jgi:serine/threonine protein kinase
LRVSPEQIRVTVDGRADIYSLGCVLFESSQGETPFARDRGRGLWAHVREPPRAPLPPR